MYVWVRENVWVGEIESVYVWVRESVCVAERKRERDCG